MPMNADQKQNPRPKLFMVIGVADRAPVWKMRSTYYIHLKSLTAQTGNRIMVYS